MERNSKLGVSRHFRREAIGMLVISIAPIVFGILIAVIVPGLEGSPEEPSPMAQMNPVECPIPGETIQWIADYCMARLSTDDEIAASACIADERQVIFRSECIAKTHFKYVMCELAISRRARSGPVDACVNDPTFVGPVVRDGGVGA